MSDLIKAANEAAKLVKMLKGIEDISKAIESLGSIEQATSEAIKLLDTKRAEIVSAEAELLDANSKVKKAKDSSKTLLDQASQKSVAIVDEAKAKSAEIMGEAFNKQKELEEKLVTMTAEISGLNEQIVSRQKDLEEIEGKITKAKNYLSKMAAA